MHSKRINRYSVGRFDDRTGEHDAMIRAEWPVCQARISPCRQSFQWRRFVIKASGDPHGWQGAGSFVQGHAEENILVKRRRNL